MRLIVRFVYKYKDFVITMLKIWHVNDKIHVTLQKLVEFHGRKLGNNIFSPGISGLKEYRGRKS